MWLAREKKEVYIGMENHTWNYLMKLESLLGSLGPFKCMERRRTDWLGKLRDLLVNTLCEMTR